MNQMREKMQGEKIFKIWKIYQVISSQLFLYHDSQQRSLNILDKGAAMDFNLKPIIFFTYLLD